MTYLLRSMFLCLCLVNAGPVLPDGEVHVVAVGNGYQTADFYALPAARVLVDRPGQDVTLVLLDGGQIHWQIEATDGTIIVEIVRSGPNTLDSEVSLFDIPIIGVQVPGLPLAFNPWGRDFRILVDTLTEMFGTTRIHSFHGTNQIREDAVRVDRVDMTTIGLLRDYLSPIVDVSDDVPPDIRNWYVKKSGNKDVALDFDETGISLTDPSGTRHFPVTPDVPDIVLPVAAVYDTGTQMIYGVTLGGEGYLYAVDTQSGDWRVVTDLDAYDPAGLLFDPGSRLLITTGAFSRPGAIKVFGLDGSRSSRFIPTTAFPGLTDLFDYGNAHGPPLTPLAYSDGWLLVRAVASGESASADSSVYRTYAVQIANGDVRLLDFRNH